MEKSRWTATPKRLQATILAAKGTAFPRLRSVFLDLSSAQWPEPRCPHWFLGCIFRDVGSDDRLKRQDVDMLPRSPPCLELILYRRAACRVLTSVPRQLHDLPARHGCAVGHRIFGGTIVEQVEHYGEMLLEVGDCVVVPFKGHQRTLCVQQC